jgi:N-glycosylase/DNA lyase
VVLLFSIRAELPEDLEVVQMHQITMSQVVAAPLDKVMQVAVMVDIPVLHIQAVAGEVLAQLAALHSLRQQEAMVVLD